MKYTIKEGRHFASPPTLGLFIDKKSIIKTVSFDDSCRYTLADGDQEDVNKLFGIGYFWSHHTDSARFGWRYNPTTDVIDIVAYCYVDNKRVIFPITSLSFNKEYKFVLTVEEKQYKFEVLLDPITTSTAYAIIYKTHNKRLGFPLGPYFGGNKTAPHNLSLEIK